MQNCIHPHLHTARSVRKHHRIVLHERAAWRAAARRQLGRQPSQALQRSGRAARPECAAGRDVGGQDAVGVLALRQSKLEGSSRCVMAGEEASRHCTAEAVHCCLLPALPTLPERKVAMSPAIAHCRSQ